MTGLNGSLLPEFAYNNWIHTSTQSSPFQLDTGQDPHLGAELILESQLESLDNFMSRMAHMTNEVRSALVKTANDMAPFYDAHCCEAPQYNVEDKCGLTLRISE